MSTLLRLSSLPLTLLSTYGAYNSYIAITNLQTYEATSKKLAEWSSEAAKQLHKTRTTQATAAVTILLSLATSLTLTLTPTLLPASLTHAAPPALFVLVQLAHNHVRNFWASSDGETVGMKVPLPNLEQYNEAERATEEVLRVLGWVGLGWGVGVGVEVVGWVVGW